MLVRDNERFAFWKAISDSRPSFPTAFEIRERGNRVMKSMHIFAIFVIVASVTTGANADVNDEKERVWNFDADAHGAAPEGWSIHQTNPSHSMATWQVAADSTAPSGSQVLALTKTQNVDGTFNMAIAGETSYRNVDLSVHVKAVGGSEDQGGGPVWRCQDENNYYVTRFNPLESNFRLYFVKKGRRKQLQSTRIHTEPGKWYTIRVTMIGDHISAYLDGQKLLEATDDTFEDAGLVGLWTKADAVTRFDDLRVHVTQGHATSLMTLRQTIELPGVTGRIDHLALDAMSNRLFLAALENGTMEVVDLTVGKRIHSIDGLREPQGILYLSKSKRVIVASGGDGTVRSFDTNLFKEITRCDLGSDADNIRWESSTNLLYVGFGNGALGVLEAETLTKQGEIKLGGHPESFQLARFNDHIYVNVPDARQIAIIDRKNNTVMTSWAITAIAENYPMALDEAGKRLFVACRTPPRLLVYDTVSGDRLATAECVGDADDIFYDIKRNRIYVVGGEGFVDVFAGSASSTYLRLAHIRTSTGARTGLFVPKRGLLYIAAPAQEKLKAKVLVYQVSR